MERYGIRMGKNEITKEEKKKKEQKELVIEVKKDEVELEGSLEEVVVALLKKYNLTLVTAESVTGGLFAGRIINVAGASDVLKVGFITYSNKAKRKYLDVQKSTLKKYGEVSKQTAKEMARGAAIGADSDTAIAFTGLAGPSGGTEEKPIGLVYIACYVKEKITVEEFHFEGERQDVREAAVKSGLELLRRCIVTNYTS